MNTPKEKSTTPPVTPILDEDDAYFDDIEWTNAEEEEFFRLYNDGPVFE